MTTYPNQKAVCIHRDMPKNTKESKRAYSAIYNDSIENASKKLGTKHTAFRLYLYLVRNQDNYSFALSTQDFSEKYGVSVKAAKDAVNDLIEAGYLVCREKNLYDFYEDAIAEIEEIVPVEEVRKSFKKKGSDEVVELTYSELVDKIGKERAEEAWRNAQ